MAILSLEDHRNKSQGTDQIHDQNATIRIQRDCEKERIKSDLKCEIPMCRSAVIFPCATTALHKDIQFKEDKCMLHEESHSIAW